ncbi:hypothetical protein IWW39_000998 [Coemansia spiralis]|uniref:UBA domain-containing protein n=1 Tax=Coemansia spiralis TaxID=417178 RepID=A0A9W8L4U3_9FUNG|nr:hypothetical protein IWW39_000998 [Coemansia spiralis]
MNEHVQGVKLRFELPFKLPAPVSFPFESIGDFRPISRIPKYDFSLEKKIMKEISKQKQEDQFDMLRQAQQQLSMVDLIASRKNRHKGKEPERTFQAVAAGGGVTSPLTKPRSDSGVTRPQSAAASGVYASTEAGKRKQAELSTPLKPQPKPQKPAQGPSDVPAQFGASMSPADTIATAQGSQVERPHSAEPVLTIMKQSDPAAPAIPPKPFASFSEFDYARDEPSGSSTLEQSSGHVEQVSTLVSMGFSRPQALQALEMYDYDVNKASNYLIDKAVFSGN